MIYYPPLHDLPNFCACGGRFNINDALRRKKGGFVAQRHDGVRNLLTLLPGNLRKDVEIKPHLRQLATKDFTSDRPTQVLRRGKIGLKADGFWRRLMVFKEHENEKKKKYQQIVHGHIYSSCFPGGRQLTLTGRQFNKIQIKTYCEVIHLVNSMLELKTRNG